jgi:hypothetical protein
MAFAKDGTHFITAGLRHIKFWNLSSAGKTPMQVFNDYIWFTMIYRLIRMLILCCLEQLSAW